MQQPHPVMQKERGADILPSLSTAPFHDLWFPKVVLPVSQAQARKGWKYNK
jgi:hypothetical protein